MLHSGAARWAEWSSGSPSAAFGNEASQVGRHGTGEIVVCDEQPVLAQAEHTKDGFDPAGGVVPGCQRRFVRAESLNFLAKLPVEKVLGIRALDADETEFG